MLNTVSSGIYLCVCECVRERVCVRQRAIALFLDFDRVARQRNPVLEERECVWVSPTHGVLRHVPRVQLNTVSSGMYLGYRGTSLIRNSLPLGPYSRTMSRALRWS